MPPKIEGCPGLIWRPRAKGIEARWQCRTDMIERGFRPKSQRLWYGTGEPSETETAFIVDTCNRLQAEMLIFGRGGLPEVSAFDGTWKSLIYCFQHDADSPYRRKVRHQTRGYYDTLCRYIDRDMGEKTIAEIRGRDMLRSHEKWSENGTKISMGHSVVKMVRILLSFGVTILEDDACLRLSMILKKMQFPMGKPRSERLTADYATLIRKGAHEVGKPSIALAQAFQFEGMFRQKDVIGEYVPLDEKNFMSAVIVGNSKWGRGLDWREIDGNWILRHVTSKRQKLVVVDLKLAPMVVDELNLLHGLDRSRYPASGPVINSERHGVPWHEQEFRRHWRLIANRMEIPKAVRNMDSRAGAISEATEAGAELEQVRQAATHSDIAMTQRYSRAQENTVANVLQMRVAHRNRK